MQFGTIFKKLVRKNDPLTSHEAAVHVDTTKLEQLVAERFIEHTSPPPRQPLTDEQILHRVDTHVGGPSPSYPLDNSDWIDFARAIEAAHGIKE